MRKEQAKFYLDEKKALASIYKLETTSAASVDRESNVRDEELRLKVEFASYYHY